MRWLLPLGVVLLVGGLGLQAVVAYQGRQPAPHIAVPPQLPPFLVEPRTELEAAVQTVEPPGPHPAAGVPLFLALPTLDDLVVPVVPIRMSERALLPPSNPQVIGWWRGGAKPGAVQGGAVLTGHTVHTGGGALDDLETLRRGDRIRVRTAQGLMRYDVSAVSVYRKATLAHDAARVFSQSVPSRLVLVTCEDWNGSVYLSNVVVFAEPLRRDWPANPGSG